MILPQMQTDTHASKLFPALLTPYTNDFKRGI